MEHLFVCAQSADPYSVLVLDPLTGTSRWALRGAELQQNAIQTAEPIGENPAHLFVAMEKATIAYTIPLIRPTGKGAPSSSIKSFLSHKARFVQSHPSGQFLFIGADNKLMSYYVGTGQLLSIVEEHIRELSAMRISSCGHFLVSGSLDGDVRVYLTASLISEPDNGCAPEPKAFAAFSPHSLPITDVCLCNGGSSAAALRVLTVSADHSAVLYSLASRQILLRITADQPLSACCVDPAELRLFLASESGTICAVDICTKFQSEFLRFSSTKAVQQKDCAVSSTSSSVRFAQQHNSAPCRIAVSADGTRLASGDCDGRYCIWDANNGQCLRSAKMNGPISALSFRLNWPIQRQQEKEQQQNGTEKQTTLPLVASLQRKVSTFRKVHVLKHWEEEDDQQQPVKDQKGLLLELYNSLINRINVGAHIPLLHSTLLGSGSDEADEGGGNDDDPLASSTPMSTKKLALRSGAKRRRQQTETAVLFDGDNDNFWALDRTATSSMDCTEGRVRSLEHELARVTQLNAELYGFAASVVLDEGGGGGSADRSDSAIAN